MNRPCVLPSLILSLALLPVPGFADHGMGTVSVASALTPSAVSIGQTRSAGSLGDAAVVLDDSLNILEEVVVQAPRRVRQKPPIDAALLRDFRRMVRMQEQREELDWLKTMSRQGASRLKVGYDPHFEQRFRHADPAPGGSLEINQRPALIRVELR
ncbi:MAG: hypothetical protein AAGG11_24070 [Pseudomonadota bacterium]